jgi:protein SCO1/2
MAGLLALGLGCGRSTQEATPQPANAPTAAEKIVERLRLSGVPFSVPLPKPDFTLTDTSGKPFHFHAATQGYLTLLFFGYTNCPDVCPVHLANIAAVLKRDPDLYQDLKVVFVGVDAPRDTPKTVRRFLDQFDPSFIGLTGTPAELERAELAAAVPPAFVEKRFKGGYTVSHAAWVLLYTRDDLGHLRYPFGTRQSEWAHDLAVLARQGWPAS